MSEAFLLQLRAQFSHTRRELEVLQDTRSTLLRRQPRLSSLQMHQEVNLLNEVRSAPGSRLQSGRDNCKMPPAELVLVKRTAG